MVTNLFAYNENINLEFALQVQHQLNKEWLMTEFLQSNVCENNHERNSAIDHYKHTTVDERETIFLIRNHGNSLLEIASHIKRSYSTVSQKLDHSSIGKSYSSSKAQEKYKQCKEKLVPAIQAFQSNIPKTGIGLILDDPVDINELSIPIHDCQSTQISRY